MNHNKAMRTSKFHLATVKETPTDAEIVSHRLMVRSGMIRKLGAGIYTWTPLGLRVLRKVEQIVREEMNAAGALELFMPAVQPAELWEETGRWQDFGPLLLKITDRGEREFCFGPTHEEVITDFARNEIRSYKQLPICFYQIQSKFRDEIRPRFGVMRAREFLMKDAYSFHMDEDSLGETYDRMYQAYSEIIRRIGLQFRAVEADSGAIGGNTSHEFQVLANSGEDRILFCPDSEYAANVEQAEAVVGNDERAAPTQEQEKVSTPDAKSIAEVAQFLKVQPEQCLKTLIVADGEDKLHALVLRGDHQLNEIKVGKLDEFRGGWRMADDDEVKKALGCPTGFVGPVGIDLPIIADRSAAVMSDFVCGANELDMHLTGVDWDRDCGITRVEDIREAQAGDPSPDGKGVLTEARGIEVGHIFQLGSKYAEAMNAVVLDEQGKSRILTMGCYGIGVSRMVAAAIEQNHDDKGIIWPKPIAPFELAILPMNGHKSERARSKAEELYDAFKAAGVDVLLEDRPLRPGVMFAEMELIGIPHRIVVGDKGLDNGEIEYRARDAEANEFIAVDDVVEQVLARLQS